MTGQSKSPKTRARRDYGTGTVYQRCEPRYGCPPMELDPADPDGKKKIRPAHNCAARWYGEIDAGWSSSGARRRPTVSAKTEAEAKKKLARKIRDLEDGDAGVSDRTTVKAWAETYLELRKLPPKALSPNGWNAAASPIKKWIIPTIGHRRLRDLTPADVRAVAKAQYDAGLKTSTADATQRAMMTMLRRAVVEGHKVPERVFLVDRPGMSKSDRTDLTLAESLACLKVAADMEDGIRWVFALIYGARQGEVLGLGEFDPLDGHPLIDWDAKTIALEWQLQDLQLEDPKNPSKGYRVHRDYEAVQLAGMYHLVRPKSKSGYRVLPMDPFMEVALQGWLEVRPENPWGLLFTEERARTYRNLPKVMPRNDKDDREQFYAIQEKAGVRHPSGKRHYYVHECRNFSATRLDELKVSDNAITSMLGHASIRTTRGYQTAHMDVKREAVVKMVELLELSPKKSKPGE